MTESPSPDATPRLAPDQKPGAEQADSVAHEQAGNVRSKPQSVETIEQFLTTLYEGSFKRGLLKGAELEAMRGGPIPDASQEARLLDLTRSDRVLEKTRQLMLIAIQVGGPGGVRQVLLEFGGKVLQQHPAFSAPRLQSLVQGQFDGMVDPALVSELVSQDYAALSWAGNAPPLAKRQIEQCKANSVHCLLALLWAARALTLEQAVQALRVNLWNTAARRLRTELDRFCALLTSRDPVGGAVTLGAIEAALADQKHRADVAVIAQERVQSRLIQVETRLTAVEADLEVARSESARLASALGEASRAHATAKAHWTDDYESLRGRVLRRLEEEVSLLDDGLHAIGQDPPKIHVMEDHAERAIDGLKREIEKLRRGE